MEIEKFPSLEEELVPPNAPSTKNSKTQYGKKAEIKIKFLKYESNTPWASRKQKLKSTLALKGKLPPNMPLPNEKKIISKTAF